MIKKLIIISIIILSLGLLTYGVIAATKLLTAKGNAQIATTQKVFGTGSGLFDGAGDYTTSSVSADYTFGTGDFTLEAWVRYNAFSTYQPIMSSGIGANWTFYYQTITPALCLYTGGADLCSNWTASTSLWYHIAVSRQATSTRLFVNGTQVGVTKDNATDMGQTTLQVGGSSGDAVYTNGYIDEVRVSKGIARYTSNFSTSTAAFPCDQDAYTVLLMHMDGTASSTTFTDDSMTVCPPPSVGGGLLEQCIFFE
jgi:hypothetical protein